MSDPCLIGPYTPTGKRWNGVSSDGTLGFGYVSFDGIYSVSTVDWTSSLTQIVNGSGIFIHGMAVDADDRVWWTQSPDFSTITLKSAELDGSDVQTEATGVALTAPFFYDPFYDWFWYIGYSPSPGMWSLEKDGTKTRRWAAYSQTFDSRVWTTYDGAAWSYGQMNSTGVRLIGIAPTTFAEHSATTASQSEQTLTDCREGLIAGDISDADVLRFTIGAGSALDQETIDCLMTGVDGNGYSIQTPDYTRVWYVFQNSSDNKIWERACASGMVPPLVLYDRHDPLPTGAPVLPQFWNTRQGIGHFQNAGGRV